MTTLSSISQDARVTRSEVSSIDRSFRDGSLSRDEVATFARRYSDIFEGDARAPMNDLLGRAGAPAMSGGPISRLRGLGELNDVFEGTVTLGQGRNETHPGVVSVQRALMALANRDENPRIMPSTGADGSLGANTTAAVRAFQEDVMRLPDDEVDGLVGPDTIDALDQDLRTGAVDPSRPRPSSGFVMNFRPNAAALRTARASSVGQRFIERTPRFADTYRRAESLSGVPAEFLAALHANESGQGELSGGALGPESGFGLDDRWVTTAWANRCLARYGLGSWARGSNSSRAVLQSAVVAAEHFKRNAGAIGIEVGMNMSTKELAGAVTCYTSGVRLGQRALASGRSWMFDPSDSNPNPLHPGGTSRGPRGQTIRIPPGRKAGLLRWDVLIPLASELLRS